MAFKRIKEYIQQPYEHPGEGKLVRKLGKWQFSIKKDNHLYSYRLLHLDILLSNVLHQLSRSLEPSQCVRQWYERRPRIQRQSVQSDQHSLHCWICCWTGPFELGSLPSQATHFLSEYDDSVGSTYDDHCFCETSEGYHGDSLLPGHR